jgi:hypothetical protein
MAIPKWVKLIWTKHAETQWNERCGGVDKKEELGSAKRLTGRKEVRVRERMGAREHRQGRSMQSGKTVEYWRGDSGVCFALVAGQRRQDRVVLTVMRIAGD